MHGSNFSGEGGGAVGGAQGLTSEHWLMWERCVSLRERNFCLGVAHRGLISTLSQRKVNLKEIG